MTANDIFTAIAISAAPTLAILINAIIAWQADRRKMRRLTEIEDLGRRTNVYVNGQRLELIILIRDLRARIAKENPDDEDAQVALARAEKVFEETTRAAHEGRMLPRPQLSERKRRHSKRTGVLG